MTFCRSFSKTCLRRLIEIGIVFGAQVALASPATFVTALPVAKNQILARFNWNATYGTQKFTSFQFPFNIAYGLTSKWTIFTTFNLGHTSLEVPRVSGDQRETSAGWGDSLAFIRYTLFSVDKATSTMRLAPLAGLYLPSGGNTLKNSRGLLPGPLQTGSGKVSPYGGVAFDWVCTSYGFAADGTIRHNRITHSGEQSR